MTDLNEDSLSAPNPNDNSTYIYICLNIICMLEEPDELRIIQVNLFSSILLLFHEFKVSVTRSRYRGHERTILI